MVLAVRHPGPSAHACPSMPTCRSSSCQASSVHRRSRDELRPRQQALCPRSPEARCHRFGTLTWSLPFWHALYIAGQYLPLGARRSALVISLALRAWSGRSALQEIGTWALVVTSKHHASLCFRAAHLQHRGWLRVRGLCGIVRFNHSGERSIVDDISTGSGVAGGSDLCTDCCRRHRYVGEPAEHHRRHRVIVDTRPLDVHDRCADGHDSASSAGGAVDRSDRRGR